MTIFIPVLGCFNQVVRHFEQQQTKKSSLPILSVFFPMFLNMWSIHVMLARNCQVFFPAEMLLLNVECPYHYGLYNDRSLDPPGPVRNHNQLLSELDINIFLRLSSTLTKRTREIIVLKKRSPVNNALFLLMVGPFMIFLSPTRWIPYSLRTA